MPPGTSTTRHHDTPALSSATSWCWRNCAPTANTRWTEESAFLLRIPLIHDYRRLLLRDPELPDVLLPGDWPGHQAGNCAAKSTTACCPPPNATWTGFQLANGKPGKPRRRCMRSLARVDPLG